MISYQEIRFISQDIHSSAETASKRYRLDISIYACLTVKNHEQYSLILEAILQRFEFKALPVTSWGGIS